LWPKGEEALRKLLNGMLHNTLYTSPYISVIHIEGGVLGHVAGMGEKKNGYVVLVRKPVRKRQLVSCRCGWEDNVRVDF
jgi:hypothetical protein